MSIITPSKLYGIDFAVKGWTRLIDWNMKRLNTILYLEQIGNVQVDRAWEDRDLLVWNATTEKWVQTRFYDYYRSTTSTSTTSTTTSTTTSSSSTTTTTTGA